MSLASLLVLFAVPCLLLLLVVLYALRSLFQRGPQPLPDRSGYGWRYPGTVRGGLVHCHRCHCSHLHRRPYHTGKQLHYCSLCGTALFVS
jgi:hypothetical protein